MVCNYNFSDDANNSIHWRKKRICQEVPLKFDNTGLRPGAGIDSNLREEDVVLKWSGFRKNFANCQELEGRCKHVVVFDLIPYQISSNNIHVLFL
jgi:hypothetical protein